MAKKRPSKHDAPSPPLTLKAKKREYVESHRNRMKQRSRDQYEDASDIGPIPPVVNPKRKEKCRENLGLFAVTYFPNSAGLKPHSEAHKKVIARIQWSILEGQDIWNCVFRGFSKTTLAIIAVIWALLYGHRKFILLVAANKTFSKNLLRMVKSAIQTNDLLFEDFPEVCFPVRAMGGRSQRCATQTVEGELTLMQWGTEEIRFPTIPDSPGSAGICMCTGITGAINGLVRSLPDGRNVRPDWWLGDDLQTRETARSEQQIANRVDAIQHSVMMLGGNLESIGGCVNGTLFRQDDLMQRLANPDLFPSFSGEVVPMVVQWPTAHESFWLSEYAKTLCAFDPKIPGDRKRAADEATALYKSRRREAEENAVVTWEHCYKEKHGEISAIQHAYNILILQGEEVFSTECQQQVYVEPGSSEQLQLSDVTVKLSGLKHRQPPPNTVRIVTYIDVQDESLWFVVVAWTCDFTGYVIDYGEWPDQRSRDVSKKRLKQSLTQKYKTLRNREARLRQGLSDLCDSLLSTTFTDADGHEYSITFGFVDCADGDSSLPVRSWIRGSRWNRVLRPSMGLGLGPSDTPLGERKKADGEVRRGLNWSEKKDKKVRGGTIVDIDTNRWKTFLANRWRSGSHRPANDPTYRPNEPGALYLWGTDANTHATFGSHQLSEYGDRQIHGRTGRSLEVWRLRPGADNERFDCMVGCCVLADYAGGISLKDAGLKSTPRPKRRGTRKATYL